MLSMKKSFKSNFIEKFIFIYLFFFSGASHIKNKVKYISFYSFFYFLLISSYKICYQFETSFNKIKNCGIYRARVKVKKKKENDKRKLDFEIKKENCIEILHCFLK